MKRPSPAVVAPLFLRNLITAAIVFAYKTILCFSGKSKLLEKFRVVLVTCLLFFLRLFSPVLPFAKPNFHSNSGEDFKFAATKHEMEGPAPAGGGDSVIARAIWRLLSVMNDVPVSSGKYEVVRSLAERLIDENQAENSAALLEVNRRVLTASFLRTLGRLEAAVERKRRNTDETVRYGLNRVARAAVRAVGDGFWGHVVNCGGEEVDQSAEAAEKLAAELLWLAEEMAGCGFAEEAVEQWASASGLARLALWAEPRLQGSMVKVSAFLFNQAKEYTGTEEAERERWRQMKKKMLTSWLPLLCRASNGTNRPILRAGERAELEKVLEDTIEALKQEEQEQVLSVWLRHFTCNSSSDWPNLHASYARWCSSSRKLLLLQCKPIDID